MRTSAPFTHLRSLATFARALKAAHSFIIVRAFSRAAVQPAMLAPPLPYVAASLLGCYSALLLFRFICLLLLFMALYI